MTDATYQIICNALIEQRKRVSQSPEEAAKLIDDLGIRHLLIPMDPNTRKKTVSRKATRKSVSKK